MKHKHADVMLEYAKDAQESDKPWVNWEFLNTQIGFWRKCTAHPEWKAYHNYRRKIKTIRIGEYDAPISMFVEKPECHSDNDHVADTSKKIDDACKIAYQKHLEKEDDLCWSRYRQGWLDALAWKAMAEEGGDQ